MKTVIILLSGIILLACNPSVRSIDYGIDSCHYCKMNIADPRFAAQLVTEKGKIFTYDAIECMVNDLADSRESHAALVVMDYNNPNQWINASEGHYVINNKIQSPMGAHLACFSSKADAYTTLDIPQDSILDWNTLVTKRFTLEGL